MVANCSAGRIAGQSGGSGDARRREGRREEAVRGGIESSGHGPREGRSNSTPTPAAGQQGSRLHRSSGFHFNVCDVVTLLNDLPIDVYAVIIMVGILESLDAFRVRLKS